MQEDLHDHNFANSGNSAQNSDNIDPLSPFGSDSAPMLSQELKKLRLRISDYNKSPVVDAVCQKVSPFPKTFLDLASYDISSVQ